MKLAAFDTHASDHEALATANGRVAHELTGLEPRLTWMPGRWQPCLPEFRAEQTVPAR